MTAPEVDASRGRALALLHEAVLAVAAERSTEPVLQRLVDTARRLVDARYAALGIPDGEGGFAQFITSGMSAEQVAAIGPLPRVHGLLGAMLSDPEPYRTPDITADPRFEYWPPAHPVMRSFLGVPVRASGEVIAAFYLTDKECADEFTAEDEDAICLLASHGAVAIENARLWDRMREHTTLEERARIARELHDAMSQTLFSLQLTAATAEDAVRDDPDAAVAHIRTVRELAAEVQRELRALIVDLRPPALADEGLAAALRKHVDVLQRIHDVDLRAEVDPDIDLPEQVAEQLLRVAQEALHNALRHAGASTISVRLARVGDGVELEVRDDGRGFDPADRHLRATRLGIVSMRHRVRAAGGVLWLQSAPGSGTTVRARVDG